MDAEARARRQALAIETLIGITQGFAANDHALGGWGTRKDGKDTQRINAVTAREGLGLMAWEEGKRNRETNNGK